MIDEKRVYGKRYFSAERAEQAMKMRGLSKRETATSMGLLNGGSYKDNNDGNGCYKGFLKALKEEKMTDKMLDKFCETVNVDPYVIRGNADEDLYDLYEVNCIISDCGSFEDYKKSLDLNLYPYKGNFPRINDSYEPGFLEGSELLAAYDQLLNYFGVRWINTQPSNDDTNSNMQSKDYYLLMDNILEAVCKCIGDFANKPQTTMIYTPEQSESLLNSFRVELFNNGLIE